MTLKVCTIDENDIKFIEEIKPLVIEHVALADEKILQHAKESFETNKSTDFFLLRWFKTIFGCYKTEYDFELASCYQAAYKTNFMDYPTLECIRVKIHNFLNDSLTDTKHYYLFTDCETRCIYKLIGEAPNENS